MTFNYFQAKEWHGSYYGNKKTSNNGTDCLGMTKTLTVVGNIPARCLGVTNDAFKYKVTSRKA